MTLLSRFGGERMYAAPFPRPTNEKLTVPFMINVSSRNIRRWQSTRHSCPKKGQMISPSLERHVRIFPRQFGRTVFEKRSFGFNIASTQRQPRLEAIKFVPENVAIVIFFKIRVLGNKTIALLVESFNFHSTTSVFGPKRCSTKGYMIQAVIDTRWSSSSREEFFLCVRRATQALHLGRILYDTNSGDGVVRGESCFPYTMLLYPHLYWRLPHRRSSKLYSDRRVFGSANKRNRVHGKNPSKKKSKKYR